MTKEEIKATIEKENIKFVKLLFVDIKGETKTVEVFVPNNIDDILDGKIMLDGSSVAGFKEVHESDLYLLPDYKSFRRTPFYDDELGNMAIVVCDVTDTNGKPIAGCTRSILQERLKKAKKIGAATVNIGFEPEFFLFRQKPDGNKDMFELLLDCAGYAAIESDSGARIRREIIVEMSKCKIHPITSIHENAPSQHEISYAYADALSACDNLIILKMLIGDIAKSHGLLAVFSPKPIHGVCGNGLHTHISLEDKDGKNMFACKQNRLSIFAMHFIAGILTHAKALCYLTNATQESYKRLVPGYEAPTNICWGWQNRSTMIRIPKACGRATRLEIRNPDCSSNPYLAVAGIVMAGIDGIKNELVAPAPIDVNVYRLTEKERIELGIASLPKSIEEAQAEYEKNQLFKNLQFDTLPTKSPV